MGTCLKKLWAKYLVTEFYIVEEVHTNNQGYKWIYSANVVDLQNGPPKDPVILATMMKSIHLQTGFVR